MCERGHARDLAVFRRPILNPILIETKRLIFSLHCHKPHEIPFLTLGLKLPSAVGFQKAAPSSSNGSSLRVHFTQHKTQSTSDHTHYTLHWMTTPLPRQPITWVNKVSMCGQSRIPFGHLPRTVWTVRPKSPNSERTCLDSDLPCSLNTAWKSGVCKESFLIRSSSSSLLADQVTAQ